MISMVSTYLVSLLLKERIIEAGDQETYKYGFEITIANLVNGMIVLLIGFALHQLPEALVFYLTFLSLRFFCGGYKADSYLRCFLCFCVSTAICLMVSGWIARSEKAVIVLFFVAATALWLCVFKMAPVEHENRPLTNQERLLFKKRSMQASGFWTTIGIILWVVCQIQMTASLISAFIAVTILMTGGKSHEKRNS